jgi:hypothetical protein
MVKQPDNNNEIPSVTELTNIMEKYSQDLYNECKRELGIRLRNLEFEGYISKNDINVSDIVYRLPNPYLNKAICNLKIELERLGYDYDFRFENIELNWVLFYHIVLPDREEENDIEQACNIPLPDSSIDSDGSIDSDDSLNLFCMNIQNAARRHENKEKD